MKKIFTLIAFAIVFFYGAVAQTNAPCTNAQFGFTLSGNNVSFTPVANYDSQFVYHSWSFGDGSNTVNVVAPSHFYNNYGTYVVVHIVTRMKTTQIVCSDTIRKEVLIPNNAPCYLKASFTYKRDSVQTNKVYFTNTSTTANDIHYVRWDFGDGTTSNDFTATHVYPTSGLYKVCLLVKRDSAASCGSDTCMSFQVQVTVNCDLQANIVYSIDTSKANLLHFFNFTNVWSANDSSIWTFGDGSISYNRDPSHLFINGGTYNVCLLEKRMNLGAAPCVSEFCKTITVASVPACDLKTNFSSTTDTSHFNLVHFTNKTVGILSTDSTIWTFGDGTTSYDVNPNHTFANAGVYNVCLHVKRSMPGAAPCVSEFCRTVTISAPCNLLVDYSYKMDSASSIPYTYAFAITSPALATGDSAYWVWGDGKISHDRSVKHSFGQPGTYTVCLYIKKYNSNTTYCAASICKTIIIAPTSVCNLQAYYTNTIKDSTHSNVIQFANVTGNISNMDSTIWTFGDGTTSYDKDPLHTFANAGTYHVCLHVKRIIPGAAPCVAEYCKDITVAIITPCNIQPNYSWKLDSGTTVHFTNASVVSTTNATVTWYFGDGASATSWNASHTYTNPGTYYVCLRMQTNNTCVAYKCDSIIIPTLIPECKNLSLFTYNYLSTDRQSYYFTPTYIGSNIQYTWTFGDGAGLQLAQAKHRYAIAGNYVACLTAFKNTSCAATTCKTIAVTTQLSCDTVKISYNYYKDGTTPNKIYFYTIANAAVSQQSWTIADLSNTAMTPITLQQNNPTYTFTDTGYYRVCLHITVGDGCVKEYCNTIHIDNIASSCELYAYPNPVHTTASVNLQQTSAEVIHIYLYTDQGVLLSQSNQPGIAGNNVVTVKTDALTAGSYTIKLIYGNKTCYAKFQKL
ncbi:PKD domain-containing protein [Ferruginibacter albus]|uniref:PKD domain-containing protein n=1 Tax=Ferruginibacter albus TaxID=2875540 RepID=UPI001CC6F986|nr:PKD domain-containing protein [Ferruginibacter albus]UAY51891.1 PKD domain-containing protein [Ferruginibacter albus]